MSKEPVATELEFLRYFYEVAADYMGPADWDIYYSIQKSFVNYKGKELPEGYCNDEEIDE